MLHRETTGVTRTARLSADFLKRGSHAEAPVEAGAPVYVGPLRSVQVGSRDLRWSVGCKIKPCVSHSQRYFSEDLEPGGLALSQLSVTYQLCDLGQIINLFEPLGFLLCKIGMIVVSASLRIVD